MKGGYLNQQIHICHAIFRNLQILIKNMEQQELFYCFNPYCSQSNSRVFQKCEMNTLHLTCEKWIVSQQTIVKYSQDPLSFDVDIPLSFNSAPLEAQAYIYFNKQKIDIFFRQYLQALNIQIIKEVQSFQTQFKKTLQELLSFSKYSDIDKLAKQEGLNSNLKSLRLSQLLKKPFPIRQNITLPSYSVSSFIISKIRSDLQQIFLLKKGVDNGIKDSRMDHKKLQQPYPYDNLDVKLQFIQTLVKLETPKKIMNLQQQSIQTQLWEYITKNCNLNTAAKIMGEPLQKFYSRDAQARQSTISCTYCNFKVNIRTKSKPQTHSACSFAILQHAYKNHFSIAFQNYCIINGSCTSIGISQFMDKVCTTNIDTVEVIDSLGLLNSPRIQLDLNCIAVEIIYGNSKPIYRNQYIKGGNTRQICILLGVLIAHISMFTKKKLKIHTSYQRCQIIDSFCAFYCIEGVSTYPGGKKIKQGLKQLHEDHKTIQYGVNQND